MANLKDVVEAVSTGIAAIAALAAFLRYNANARHERAKWTVQLFEKFYESRRYRKIRDLLDCAADSPQIRTLVDEESSEFTDYLNFFELMIFLVESGQLAKADVLGIFQYYLTCLKHHSSVMAYLNNREKGFGGCPSCS